jgi:hypothetical protein
VSGDEDGTAGTSVMVRVDADVPHGKENDGLHWGRLSLSVVVWCVPWGCLRGKIAYHRGCWWSMGAYCEGVLVFHLSPNDECLASLAMVVMAPNNRSICWSRRWSLGQVTKPVLWCRPWWWWRLRALVVAPIAVEVVPWWWRMGQGVPAFSPCFLLAHPHAKL